MLRINEHIFTCNRSTGTTIPYLIVKPENKVEAYVINTQDGKL